MQKWRRRRMENKKLPDYWIELTIGDTADYLNGRGFKPSEWEVKGLPIIRIQNLNNPRAPFNYTSGEFKQCYKINGGDLLFSWSASLGVYIWKEGEAWLNQHIFKVIPYEYVIKKYLYYSLQNTIAEFYDKTHGSGMVHITKKKFEATSFLLPPLPEQRAIVSKIEQLFSDLDNGIENFKKAQEQLKIYRLAVLKNACEGKLVPTEAELARSEGRDYEPADVLLERILEERREKWNGKGKYKEPEAPDTNGLFELPEGWKWVSMNQISNLVTDGDHNPPKRVASGIPHLTAKNIRNWQISEEGCTYIIEQDFEKVCKRYLPIRGDIIITCVGTIGRTAIVPKNYIFSADRNLAVVRLISEGLTEKLLQFYLNTPAAQNSMNTASGSTAQPHLYLGKIRVFPVPLPPLAEQLRIVIEVERRLSICDKMEATITESLQKAESLRQSILKKAFEGKLLNEKELEEVRNAPDWEPAEKLLERIKAEKTNMKAKKTGKK